MGDSAIAKELGLQFAVADVFWQSVIHVDRTEAMLAKLDRCPH